MPRGDKSKYTDKQKRKAEHIAEGYTERGVGAREAKRRAWATVNKDSGGGELSGSGRGHPPSNEASRRGGRIGGAARRRKSSSRSSASGRRSSGSRSSRSSSRSHAKRPTSRSRSSPRQRGARPVDALFAFERRSRRDDAGAPANRWTRT